MTKLISVEDFLKLRKMSEERYTRLQNQRLIVAKDILIKDINLGSAYSSTYTEQMHTMGLLTKEQRKRLVKEFKEKGFYLTWDGRGYKIETTPTIMFRVSEVFGK